MKTNRMAMSTVAGLAALTLGLAGCGGSDSDNGADEAQNSSAASESAPAGTAADDDQSEDTDDGKDEAKDSTQDSSGKGLSADADLSSESPATSAEDAIKTAEKEVGNGIVHGIELDWDDKDQAWQYEVSILDGNTDHDVEIDAETGKIVKHEQDSTDDKEEAIDLNDPMTFDEALKLAQEKAEGKLVGWKLEYDDEMKEFQFDFDQNGEETEVTVDTDSKRVSVDD
ncbi:PepSY domain-containing protein [Brevibacterium sp. LE-L]|uniref:PepSY domain-containing protein n=1 Tax=Brevibacterium sp. LE-L TaxID=3418557 RepID=UPI003CFB501E